MSDKRFEKQRRRNDKWLKEKHVRRLHTEKQNLFSQSREREYIPLEKPQFAGWDIRIGFKESASRRSDFSELNQILNILNESREMFTKDVKLIRHIRNNNHKLDSLTTYKAWIGYYFDKFLNRHIKYHEYNNIPLHLRKYFSADKYYKYSINGKPYYVVNSDKFPWYECRLVISKSYHNFRMIYNTVAQSEHDKLYNLHYVDFSKFWGKGYWRDSYQKSLRAAWNSSMKEIVNKQMREEELLDYKYIKCFDNKPFGWS